MVVYKITNLINGKCYIGKDKHNNPNYLGSGRRINSAIKKYGKENFIKEILEYCNTYDELRDREVYWIKKFNAAVSPDFYNIAEENFGVGNFKGFIEEDWNNFSEKMSIINSKKWEDSNFRLKMSTSLKSWHKNMPADKKQRRGEKISKSWQTNKQLRCDAIKLGQQNSDSFKNRDLSKSGRPSKIKVTQNLTDLVIDMFKNGNLRSQISKVTLLSKWQVNTILKKVGLLK